MFEPFRIERIARKSDLINWLGWQHGLSRYLEIATRTTGFQFARISKTVFATIHRGMYRLSPDYDDGLPIAWRTESEDSSEILGPVLEQPERYDIVFVDPFHTYECSRRDLELALALLAPGGIVVVHDCHPLTPEIAAPEFRPKQWLGVTYLAFLDLMRARSELDYCVVDMDHGCGVVWQRPPGLARPVQQGVLETCDYHDWPTYFANRQQLLRLVEVDDFLAAHRRRAPTLAASVARKFSGMR